MIYEVRYAATDWVVYGVDGSGTQATNEVIIPRLDEGMVTLTVQALGCFTVYGAIAKSNDVMVYLSLGRPNGIPLEVGDSLEMTISITI